MKITATVPFACLLDVLHCHKKELLLVLFSVGFLGEHLGGRSCLGFFITMVGVALYKLVPKRSPEGDVDFLQSCARLHGVGVPRVDVFISHPVYFVCTTYLLQLPRFRRSDQLSDHIYSRHAFPRPTPYIRCTWC